MRATILAAVLILNSHVAMSLEPLGLIKDELAKYQASRSFDDLVSYYTSCRAVDFYLKKLSYETEQHLDDHDGDLVVEIYERYSAQRGFTRDQVTEQILQLTATKWVPMYEYALAVIPTRHGRQIPDEECDRTNCLSSFVQYNEKMNQALSYCITSLK
jgi:hypothetical protein